MSILEVMGSPLVIIKIKVLPFMISITKDNFLILALLFLFEGPHCSNTSFI